MGPDWLWVSMFLVGGIAVALWTSLVGLRKGHELWLWLGLHVAIAAAVVVLRVESPFWTLLVGGALSGAAAGGAQAVMLPWYRKHNAWATDLLGARGQAVRHLIVFGASVGTIFGIVAGAVAWAAATFR